jgi:hypothetical protein
MRKISTLILSFAIVFSAMSTGLTIKKFPDGKAPKLDGKFDAIWNLVDSNNISKRNATYRASLDSAYFKMAWNDTALFLIIQVTDSAYGFCNKYCTGLLDYQSDRPELYFDMNTWPGDKQPGASVGIQHGVEQYTGVMPFGADTFASFTGYQAGYYSVATHIDGDTYTEEFAFPWNNADATALVDSLGNVFAPAKGIQFGFDAYVLDVDPSDQPYSNATRKWAYWHDAAGKAWDNMGGAGTVTISTDLVGSASEVANSEISQLTITNPAADYFELLNTNNLRFNDIKIYNVLGKLVLNQNGAATKVDVTNLRSGVYFVKVLNNYKVIGQSKLLKR